MALAPPTPAQLARLRGDFEPSYYSNLVETKGYPATWEQAMACPNRLKDVTTHNVDCDLCDSRQFVYFNPQEIRVALTSLTLKEMWREIGRFDLGTAMVTTKPNVRLSYWDRITLTESRVKYTEPMQRALTQPSDRLRYFPLEVVRALGQDGKTEYTEGTDFTLALDESIRAGRLTWLPGRGPVKGAFYSIVYFYRPVYIVLDLIHQFRDTPIAKQQNDMVEMPVQAIARLDYLVANKSE